MKLYRITLRYKFKPLEVFEIGINSLQAIAGVYRRFPDAELVSHSFIRKITNEVKVDLCQVCHREGCPHST